MELAQHLHAVHAGHLDVEEHGVGPLALDGGEAVLSAGRADELIILASRIIFSESRIAASSSMTRMRGLFMAPLRIAGPGA